MDTKHIQIRDYDYPLPDERIAKFPLPERDSSKLLVYDRGRISETTFRSLPSLLPEGALMVFNNTRVIQARLHFRKNGAGALIEIFLLEPAEPAEYQENFARRGKCSWYCLVGNLKKWKEGPLTRTLTIDHSTLTITATRKGAHGTSQLIEFEWGTENEELRMKNEEFATAHDGNSDSSFFILNSSFLHVPQWMPYEYNNALSTKEALEALLHYMDEQGEEVLHATTQIIIAPGYKYHIVRRMITNFHQPQSTLLLLVSAFIGDSWHDVYDYALSHDFRFLSYGDSSLLIP